MAVTAKYDLALVIAHLRGGGAQKVLTTLANAWARDGVRVCLITLNRPDTDLVSVDPAISRVAIGGDGASANAISAIAANVRIVGRLRRAISDCGAPVVLAFVAGMGVLTILATAGLGLRVVVSERNDPARQSLGRAWDLLRRVTYPRATSVTANSPGAIEALAGFVDQKRVRYIPNPAPPARPDAAYQKDSRMILCVGRLTEQKGYDVVLRAFSRIVDAAPGWQLVVVGDGKLADDLKRQAESLGVAARVTWRGHVADPAVLYSQAAVFVLASRHEGSPNALMEAMSFGLPAIITDRVAVPGLGSIEGSTGLVFPTDDDAALAEALLRLIRDPDLRAAFGEAARVRAATDDLPSVLRTWAEVLRVPAPQS